MKRGIHFLCGGTILFLAGCMGYQLGGSTVEGVDTVHVAAVVNRTSEPAIELQVSQALRERIQFDGRLTLVNSPDQADAVIEVELTRYTLTPIAFRSDLRTTPDQYRLRIDAAATLTDTRSGKVLSGSDTYGETRFPFQSDLTTSKRIALPAAAEELAKFMVDDLIERF